MNDEKITFHDIDITNVCLGKGYTASVFKGRHKVTGKTYAVKIIDLSKDRNISF